ncbi:uncharacterized protein J4E78_009313 [Alternaria triticimaculans]|uniref:uncharacterized protein n=1 Tax=Alternaria triticimaculans TaxID=297637 RepID=UPI0020C32B59|nr:uncharacterized protein J4E78_009313 [Alternaria triticimaculans]KAI4646391.1 hypothetical protein J4E78_009313 [Alternaria triticimaculans]
MEQSRSKPASTVYPWMDTEHVTGHLRKCFKFVYDKVKLLNGRVDGMEAQMAHLKQLVEDVKRKSEADNQGLQGHIDTQKAQNQQLRNELDAERDRNQRLETTINNSQQSITRIDQKSHDLSNQFLAQKTITTANFQRTDRLVSKSTQKIESLERSGNTYIQSIVDLREDLEDRFETAVVHTQECLRHNKTAWIKGLELLRTETAEKLATTTDHFSTAIDTVQAQSREHTEAFEKTALVLDHNSQRMEELGNAMVEPQLLEGMNHRVEKLENAVVSHDAALRASQAITTRLDSLDARLGVSEVALHSMQTPTLTPPTTATVNFALDGLRTKLDAMDLCMKNEVASVRICKERLVALEKHRGTPASRKLDNRVCVLEENYGKMRNDHTDMTAKCVTHEQFAAVSDALTTSLQTTIQDHREEVKQRMEYNVVLLNGLRGQHLQNIETSLKKVVQDNAFPHLLQDAESAQPARAPALQSAYPSPPAANLTHPRPTHDNWSQNTSSAPVAFQQAMYMQHAPVSDARQGKQSFADTIDLTAPGQPTFFRQVPEKRQRIDRPAQQQGQYSTQQQWQQQVRQQAQQQAQQQTQRPAQQQHLNQNRPSTAMDVMQQRQ